MGLISHTRRNSAESCVATRDSAGKEVKMTENKTITKLIAKIDMLESGIEDFENNISVLQDDLQLLQEDMEEAIKIKELLEILEKLGDILGK